MKFSVKRGRENIQAAGKQLGYRLIGVTERGEYNFVKPVYGAGYPRFHLYLSEDNIRDVFVFSLHLDQKKPSYGDVTAHSGEYHGQVVEREVEAIKVRLAQAA